MKRLSLLFLIITFASAIYLYQDKKLQNKLMGKVHQVIPEINQTTLYKWKNGKGEWQITDTPPTSDTKYTTVNSQDQINIMPSPSKEP